MPEKLETPVPPWVQIFADLNPENVQIIEMTNPIITEMGPGEQPIEERMKETVFLLRNCLKETMVNRLEELVDETFDAIRRESKKKGQSHAGWITNIPCLASSQASKLQLLLQLRGYQKPHIV